MNQREGLKAFSTMKPYCHSRICRGSSVLAISQTRQSSTVLNGFLSKFILVGVIYLIVTRLFISISLPMWLDETWSAMIATRSSWSEFWHQAWLDCNPPLYYLFLSCWVSLFGDSNFMLRLPSCLFVIGSALLPVIRRPQGLSPSAAWVLAALMIVWQPGLLVMVDARGYGLMLFLSMASCLIMVRMLERLTLRRAVAWVAFGTAMFLTHYYAAVLILGQTAILVYRHRARMLAIWPAAIVATPGLAWFASHVSRLKDYARPDAIWYDPTSGWDVLKSLFFVLGTTNFITLGAVGTTVFFATAYRKRLKAGEAEQPELGEGNVALTAGAGAIGFVIAILVSIVQPSFADRYFTPLVPPIMIGLVLIVQRCPKRELAGPLLAFFCLLPNLNMQISKDVLNERVFYGYEQASDFVQSYRPDQLVFLWDHPGTKIMEKGSLDAIGGYFMNRAGASLAVRSVVAPLTADANEILRAAADGRRPALIWLYGTMRRSSAYNHPPSFEKDPAWTCRHMSRPTVQSETLGTIACVKTGGGHD